MLDPEPSLPTPPNPPLSFPEVHGNCPLQLHRFDSALSRERLRTRRSYSLGSKRSASIDLAPGACGSLPSRDESDAHSHAFAIAHSAGESKVLVSRLHSLAHSISGCSSSDSCKLEKLSLDHVGSSKTQRDRAVPARRVSMVDRLLSGDVVRNGPQRLPDASLRPTAAAMAKRQPSLNITTKRRRREQGPKADLGALSTR